MFEMDAVLWDGSAYPDGLAWARIPRLRPSADWVVVENSATGICGSDLHYLSGAMRHQIPDANLPAVLGHENAGVVVEVGTEVRGIAVGDRVVGEPLHPCRTQGRPLCPACQIGQYHRCQNLGHVGIPARLRLPGGYGDYSAYHHTALFPLPDSLSFEEGALLDVLACGVHALHVAQPHPGQRVIVLGCGAIGLDMLQCLLAVGVRDVVAVARHEFQAEIAGSLGAGTVICTGSASDSSAVIDGLRDSADQVYECVGGTADTLQQAVDMCRAGGQVIMLGFFSGMGRVNLSTVFLKELSILAADGYSMWGERREFDIALQMLASGQVRHRPLITHTYGRKSWATALNVAFHKRDHRCVKVILTKD